MDKYRLLEGVDSEAALKKALSNGGAFSDVFAEDKSTTIIQVENQRLDKLVQGSRSGAGIRVIHDNRTAYSYTDSITPKSLLECAKTASKAVRNGHEKAPVKEPGKIKQYKAPVLLPFLDMDVSQKIDILWKAEVAARAYHKKIKQVKVMYSDQVRNIAVANSEGLFTSDSVSYIIFYIISIASDETGIQVAHEAVGGTMGMEIFSDRPVEELARMASERAVQNLEARPAPAGNMSVVLAAEAGGTMVHEAVGHGLEADLAEQDLSVYTGMIGKQIASPLITVVDDGTIPGKRGSYSIDDEGTRSQKSVLVENGILKNYMYDKRMAMKTGKKSTGNGRRESYAHPPIVRMTNTLIGPGKDDPQSIIASVDKGLLVKRMGGGEVNTVNGDFVFEIEEGYIIENGDVGEAVRGATLTGNGPKVLMEIDMLGSDLGFGIGTCGKDGQGSPVSDAQPTLRIPEIVVGGRVG